MCVCVWGGGGFGGWGGGVGVCVCVCVCVLNNYEPLAPMCVDVLHMYCTCTYECIQYIVHVL